MIRPATPNDAPAICAIYNEYVLGSCITFEEEPVEPAAMVSRIETVTTTTPRLTSAAANASAVNGSSAALGRPATLPWLVLEAEGAVAGYAYATPWRPRSAYRHSVESTVYLRRGCTGRGLGRRLYEELLAELKRRGLHCVIGGIALPNEASRRLHEGLGFKKVAHFEQVGWKFGHWIDVGYWELILAQPGS